MPNRVARLLAVGALAATTTAAGLAGATAASASAAPERTAVSSPADVTTQAFFRGYYASSTACVNAGNAGIRAGLWSAWICQFDITVNFWALYA